MLESLLLVAEPTGGDAAARFGKVSEEMNPLRALAGAPLAENAKPLVAKPLATATPSKAKPLAATPFMASAAKSRFAATLAAALAAAFAAPDAKAQSPQSEAVFRVNQLEGQVRELNGRIEELNFQLLEISEQMRRMQQDNERRFLLLEEGKQTGLADAQGAQGQGEGSSSASRGTLLTQTPAPGTLAPQTLGSGGRETGTQGARAAGSGTLGSGTQAPRTQESGLPPPQEISPRNLAIPRAAPRLPSESDSSAGARPAQQAPAVGDERPINLLDRVRGSSGAGGSSGSSGQVQAGLQDEPLEGARDADSLHAQGMEAMRQGDFERSQRIFEAISNRFPSDPLYAEARFRLGESLFAQNRHRDAARVFFDSRKSHSDGPFAAQTLVMLGASLAAMQQRELACAIYAEAEEQFPNMESRTRTNLAAARSAASCGT